MHASRELRDLTLGLLLDFSGGDPAFLDLFSADDRAVHIGTDQAEYFTGGLRARAILRQQLGELGRWHLAPGTVEAYEEGSVGWASTRFTATLADDRRFEARCTFVFRREGSAWRLIHSHKSFPMPNTALGVVLTTVMDEVAESIEIERPDLAAVTSTEGTLTIMFTDVESSTALNEALGDDVFVALLMRHHESMTSRTRGSGGTIVKSMGDGFMVAFPSARRAIECAIEVQRDAAEIGQIRVRMGLHTGEPQRRADDFYGRDVAYAARIASAAAGGEVLVSSLVHSLVAPSGFTFSESRALDLKGFEGEHTAHVVDWGRPGDGPP